MMRAASQPACRRRPNAEDISGHFHSCLPAHGRRRRRARLSIAESDSNGAGR